MKWYGHVKRMNETKVVFMRDNKGVPHGEYINVRMLMIKEYLYVA